METPYDTSNEGQASSRSPFTSSEQAKSPYRLSSSRSHSSHVRKEKTRRSNGPCRKPPELSSSTPPKKILSRHNRLTDNDSEKPESKLSSIRKNESLRLQADSGSSDFQRGFYAQNLPPTKSPDTHASNLQKLDTMNLADPPESMTL